MALSRGLEVDKSGRNIFFIVSLVAGVCVSFAGPIAFVGLIVPCWVRAATGAPHRILAPLVLLLSGAFLVGCDTVARTLPSPIELPVGVLTTLLGALFLVKLSGSTNQSAL